ncbi:MAG: GNAT family N-acetyltransferase [Dehalococcoidia bacterium]|nr:GNAT family N-acetyltransferase [Chloroflexota bacterium]MXY71598.1 GNAT family N-acetyltransferase [Dehalococcoidia bacterium]
MTLSREDLAFRYPTNDLLRDSTAVVFRPVVPADREHLIGFARALEEDDLLFLREDITSPAVVDEWLEDVEKGETFTVIAEVGDRIVGYGSLHTEPARWTRHVGEIRLNVHPDYRGTGLGGLLAGEIRAVAPAFGVRTLSAQMPVDQLTARTVFERLGFRYQAILPGWVMDRDGRDLDLLIMAREI